jgi:Aminoglycoside/hydroxyurea antibiotic resistance kinase
MKLRRNPSCCGRNCGGLAATQRDVAVLHGDMHHENVLKFSSRGWPAIDPKGLVGERGSITQTSSVTRQRDRDYARPLSAANTSGGRGRGIGTQSAAGTESGLGRFVRGIWL